MVKKNLIRIINQCDLETNLLHQMSGESISYLKKVIKTAENIRDIIIRSKQTYQQEDEKRLGFTLLKSRLRELYPKEDLIRLKNFYELREYMKNADK